MIHFLIFPFLLPPLLDISRCIVLLPRIKKYLDCGCWAWSWVLAFFLLQISGLVHELMSDYETYTLDDYVDSYSSLFVFTQSDIHTKNLVRSFALETLPDLLTCARRVPRRGQRLDYLTYILTL